MGSGLKARGSVAAALALLAVNGIVPDQGAVMVAVRAPAPLADASSACVTVGTASTDPARAAEAARAVTAGFPVTSCMPDADLLAAEARAAIPLGGAAPTGATAIGGRGAAGATAIGGAGAVAAAVVAPTTAAVPAPTTTATTATTTASTADAATTTSTTTTTTSTGASATESGETDAGDADSGNTDSGNTDSGNTDSGDTDNTGATAPGRTGGETDGSTGSGTATGSGSGTPSSTPDEADADGTTAAQQLEWGTPTSTEDFDGDLSAWTVDDGPGHAGQGRRAPSALTVTGGVLTITGAADGTTGGLVWPEGSTSGRWEARIKSTVADPSYHALMTLLPDGSSVDGSAVDGSEIDVSGADGWHNWAVEWTPARITVYRDGQKRPTATRRSAFPAGPLHLALRLDRIPAGDATARTSTMSVAWVRSYAN